MKIYIIFLSCLCSSLAITVHYKTTGSLGSPKEYKTALKDIRLVPLNQADALQKPIQERRKETNEIKSQQKPKEQSKDTRQSSKKSRRGEKRKLTSSIARVGNAPIVQNESNHQNYIQKMANQLYMTQKHASLLSDYQKFILNQDPKVRNFVLAQTIQERNPKPFSRQRGSGRAFSETPEPVAAANADYKKIVVVTPKVQTTLRKIPQPQNDHSAQATHIKYVTLAPQSLTRFVESHQTSPKVTLLPFHTPQPYYDLGVTHKPQVKVVQVPTTVSVGLGSYESPEYYKDVNNHEDNSHHDEAKYEFMYNVKDHEKDNHFGHKESRIDKTTYGYYFVHLPDGRLETVKYWADKTGYHAKVDYQGEAKHPVHSEHSLHPHNIVHH